MWPEHRLWHRALSYYLTSASTSNKDLGEMCLHETGICSQQCGSFFMAVNRDLRSMTIRVLDREPRYAIRKS